MKDKATITKLLGITQIDAAMLFGVHPTQWSMFSSGKRPLPLHAMQLLGEMLTYMGIQNGVDKKTAEVQQQRDKQQQPEIKQKFKSLLRENKFQQMRIAREIDATMKRQEAQSRMLLLSEFLAGRNLSKETFPGKVEAIVNKKASRLEAALSAKIAEQQFRQELLVLEQQLLESKLQKLI